VVRHSWRTHLKAASDERAVVALVASYLAEWKPAEIESLPEGAWPTRISTPRGVIDQSVHLAQLHSASRAEGPGLAYLHELLLFFTHAAVTITRLAAMKRDTDCPGHRRVNVRRRQNVRTSARR
jgi:hypothetical protein